MWSKLVQIFTSLEKGFLKNALTGAGIMLTTTTIFLGAFTRALNAFETSTYSLSADLLGLAHLTGLDTAMSIILGATATRLTLSQQKLMLKVKD